MDVFRLVTLPLFGTLSQRKLFIAICIDFYWPVKIFIVVNIRLLFYKSLCFEFVTKLSHSCMYVSHGKLKDTKKNSLGPFLMTFQVLFGFQHPPPPISITTR